MLYNLRIKILNTKKTQKSIYLLKEIRNEIYLYMLQSIEFAYKIMMVSEHCPHDPYLLVFN